MTGTLKKIKKTFIIALIGLATLAFLEVGVRLIVNSKYPLLRTDPEVGSTHVKNYAGKIWDDSSKSNNYIKTNSLGYIGDEYAIEKPRDTVRIAVFGDSIVEGLQVNYYENFNKILENALNASGSCGKKYEVMNFGVGGTGTFLQYQGYKKIASKFDPDIIFLFFHEDYEDNLAKSNFDLDDYASERRVVGLKSLLLDFELPKFLFSKFQVSENFLTILKNIGLYESNNEIDSLVAETAGRPDQSARFYDYTFYLISRFQGLAEENGSKLVVITYPGEKSCQEKDGWRKNEHIVKLIDYLDKKKISYLNPSESLFNYKVKYGVCVTFNCDGHLNRDGHEAMAEILFDYISRILHCAIC
jgi:hypothetical protein